MSLSMGMMKLEMTMKFTTGLEQTGGHPAFFAKHSVGLQEEAEEGQEQGKGEVVEQGTATDLVKKALVLKCQQDLLT